MINAVVKIGETRIEVPQLTIGQLEKVAEWLEAGQSIDRTMRAALSHNLKLLEIAFETSTPRLSAEQISSLKATVGDVAAAVTTVLRVAGLAENEVAPDPEATAPDGASPPSSTASSASSPPAADTLLN